MKRVSGYGFYAPLGDLKLFQHHAPKKEMTNDKSQHNAKQLETKHFLRDIALKLPAAIKRLIHLFLVGLQISVQLNSTQKMLCFQVYV